MDLKPEEGGLRAPYGVKVTYGIHKMEAALEGKRVAEVRGAISESLNIDPRAMAVVNGSEVDEDHVLAEGDHLEFVRLSGSKGYLSAEESVF